MITAVGMPVDILSPSMILISLQCIVFTVVAIAGAAIAAGTIATGAIGASKQANAAEEAAQGQQAAADQATALQREQWMQGREDIAPWREAGVRALGQFERLAQQGPPQFGPLQGPRALNAQNYRFRPPTAADMARDPGYQFRLAQGQQALERSAAARGGLLSGGLARNLADYSQGLASQEYGQVYNRALGQNQLRYGRDLAQNQSAYERALQGYTTNYNVGMQQWQNRLAPWQTLAGGGQTAGAQLGQLGSNYASQVGNILAANANAQGASQMAQAQAWSQFGNTAANALGSAYGYWGGGMGGQNPAGTQPRPTEPYNPWQYMG